MEIAEPARRSSVPAWRDPLLQRGSPPAAGPSGLAPGVAFDGIAFTGTNPPDTVGDVGPAHVVEMVNGSNGSQLEVWNKGGASLAGPVALSSLWSSGACSAADSSTVFRGDPIVLYDPLADRWLLAELGLSNACFGSFIGCHLCVAVSQTADPVAGGWWLYDFDIGSVPDYPKLAVWPGSYLVGTNQVDGMGQRAGIYALDRAQMLAGQSAGAQLFSAPRLPREGFQLALPADLDGAQPPPAGTPAVFLRPRDGEQNGDPADPTHDRLELWQLDVSWAAPATSALSGPTHVEIAEYNGGTVGQAAAQPDGQSPLVALVDLPMHRLSYTHDGALERLAGSFTVVADGADHLGVRWFELSRSGAVWTVTDEGTYAPDAAHRFMGSAATNADGHLAVGYTVSGASPAVYPSARVAGRRPGDPPGALTTGEAELATGSAAHVNGLWGDYSALAFDPSEPCTFWSFGTFVPAGGNWATRIGAFSFAPCDGAEEIFADGFESGNTFAWSAVVP